MVEIWDGLGLDRLRHGPRHVIARWPRVKYLVRDVGVHIADAAFADPMAEYAALIETALADPDPWHGFCDYVRAVCAMQAGDRGFTDVLTQSFPSAKEFGAQRDEAFRRFTELIDRAKQTGGLRQDFVAEDLPMLLMANAGVVAATAGSTPETSPRLVAYLLQAFAARASEPLPEPSAPQRMYRALRRLDNKDRRRR
jgi:hypothetical protein